MVTIGNFDGVHLGHQALIQRLVMKAREVACPAVVVTFDPHPVKVLFPERQLHRIFDFDDQVRMLARLGVDYLVVESFTKDFARLTGQEYLSDWIVKPYHPSHLIVGYDFSFGASRKGSIALLMNEAPGFGFSVDVVPPVEIEGEAVSSSRIRKAIEQGDVALAARLLGRDFYLRGEVVNGAGRGRTIGVPTANLKSAAETLPALGVYRAQAEVDGKMYVAAVNVGRNPTFHDRPDEMPVSIEAHLLDFSSEKSGHLYGRHLKLYFEERIRDEKKFASVDELVKQIHFDIETCRERSTGMSHTNSVTKPKG